MIKSLYHMDQLSRIVVDEAHITFLSDTFRPSMAAMNRTRSQTIEVPIVLMSATVLKKTERDVINSQGFDFTRASILCSNLSRENISICVEILTIVDNKAMMEAVCNKIPTNLYSLNISGGKHVYIIQARSQFE